MSPPLLTLDFRDSTLDELLSQLHSEVVNDPFLRDAELSESLLKRTIWAKLHATPGTLVSGSGGAVDWEPCKKLLKSFASWHLRHLGSSSARISIVHVHAFLLSGIFQVSNLSSHVTSRTVAWTRSYWHANFILSIFCHPMKMSYPRSTYGADWCSLLKIHSGPPWCNRHGRPPHLFHEAEQV